MADVKISELPALTSPDGAEELVVNDSGTTKKIAIEDLFAGDNVKAKFGAGDDLQIYHDGSNSVITDVGVGNLEIRAANIRIKNPSQTKSYLNGDDGGAITIFHDGAQKLSTTATGIDVTGTVTASTGLTVGSPTNPTSSLAIIKVADSSTAISAFEITNRANADFVFKVETDLVTGGSTIARPVAFMTSNTERMRIDASGNVSIGVGAAIAPLHVFGNAVIETGSPDLYFATSASAHVNWRVAAQETLGNAWEIASGTATAGSNAVADTYTRRFSVDSVGNTTITTGNLVIGTSGKGIDFSANGNASGMSSEVLDDYEEGTWTPVFLGSGGNPTVTYNTSNTKGTYTKVGNIVTFAANLHWTAYSGGGGSMRLSLPFTASSPIGSGWLSDTTVTYSTLTVDGYGGYSPNSAAYTYIVDHTGQAEIPTTSATATGLIMYHGTLTIA